MSKRKTKEIIKLTILNVFFIVLCAVVLVPILYAFLISFSGGGTLLASNIAAMFEKITIKNYVAVLTEEPFLIWLKNTTILCTATMVLAMTLAIVAAYAFSRYRFVGRTKILKLLLILNAFPQILSMFAIFRLFKTVGLLNNRLGLVIVYAGTMCIFGIWNLKGYFDSIPVEIEEASKIDGASDLQLLVKIIFPLAVPAVIVTAVMVLIYVWNEYLFSSTFMLGNEYTTLAGGLYSLQATDYSRNWPIFTAASVLVSIPILIIFFKIQKYMVSGLTAGGVKG